MQVRYDFQFYELPFPSDSPVLTVSRGKSLLGSDVRIALRPVHDIPEEVQMPPPAASAEGSQVRMCSSVMGSDYQCVYRDYSPVFRASS